MGALYSKVVWGVVSDEEGNHHTIQLPADAKHGPVPLHVPTTIAEGGVFPTYATQGSAGLDLHALEDVVLLHDNPQLVSTGVSVALPSILYGQIAGRSGLATHHGVTVHPGVIDSDYRGEIKVLMTFFQHRNSSSSAREKTYTITKGDRIAQLLVLPVVRPPLVVVRSLDETARGEGGFGSTGMAEAVEAPASKNEGGDEGNAAIDKQDKEEDGERV